MCKKSCIFALDFMDKKTFYHIIEWSVAIAACAYLIWKLATYEDYAALWATLRAMTGSQWLAIVVCVALMPLNMTLEAWRWKTLVPMAWREAHRQVYYSKLAGLVTPWKLGEYPARALLQGEWKQTLSMGAVGSATMTLAIVIAGVVALAFSPAVLALLGDSYLYALVAVTLVLAIGLYFAPKALKQWAEINRHLLFQSLGQSLVRLSCWCVQLGLVLWALDPLTPSLIHSFIPSLFIYYLLVTITPNVPIAEVGVRGAWAIVVFGSVNAAMAGVLLWVINTLLPCLIWPFLRKSDKMFA